ncbi:MAG: S-adenosylmethionine:tRNA ribosyltransferase-isomerase [Kofleriaceae bacterium]
MFRPTDYTFELPPELIAQEPAAVRDQSRLLHVRGVDQWDDLKFSDIVDLLPADAVIVANDTRVIPARVLGKKASGGNVELLLLEPEPATAPNAWRALAKARRPLRAGQHIFVGDVDIEVLTERSGEEGSIAVALPGDPYALLEQIGRIPLPHYIHREDTQVDRDRYQTMFAQHPGAVAAPTAGFHMTPAIADQLRAKGIAITTVTLHVGYGTFEPIRVDDIREHHMHRERYVIPQGTADADREWTADRSARDHGDARARSITRQGRVGDHGPVHLSG